VSIQNEFIVFEGLDRVHTIQKMISALLGDAGVMYSDGLVYGEEGTELHQSLQPHKARLLTIQQELGILYQELGKDLDALYEP
jgi:hypothetical protein